MLADRQTTGIEECRQLLECAWRAADAAPGQAGRGEEVGAGQEILVALIGIDRAEAQRAKARRAQQRLALPAVLAGGQDHDAILHVLKHVAEEVILERTKARQSGVGIGSEHPIEFPLAGPDPSKITLPKQPTP